MSLRHAAFSAVRWTTASLVLRAMLQMGQTVVLARLLTPADFGLLAMAGAAFGIAALFVDLGLSGALIHFPDPTPEARSTLYWLNQAAAVVMMLLFMALAWPLCALYAQPDLLPVMVAMSLAMPLGALGQQFFVIAEKELRFGAVALVEVVAAMCGSAAAVLTALAGGGVYALVTGILSSAAVSSLLAWALLSDGVRPCLEFDLPAARHYLRYGAYRLGEVLANSLRAQADVLIGSAVAGPAAMGLYNVSRNLAMQVGYSMVNPVVTRVGLPVMARLQGDVPALKAVYLKTLRMTSAVNFPVYLALAAWADEAVAILLGGQWRDAAHHLRIFALWAMVASIGNPVGSLLYATGHVRRAFWWNVAQLVVLPGLLWGAASMQGTRGLAAAMLATQCLLFYPLFRFLVRPACGARFGEYAAQLFPALGVSTCAVGFGYAVATMLALPQALHLVLGGAVAAIAYLGLSGVVNRAWLASFLELLHPRAVADKDSSSPA